MNHVINEMLVQSVLVWGNLGSIKHKRKQKKETKSNKVLEGRGLQKKYKYFQGIPQNLQSDKS